MAYPVSTSVVDHRAAGREQVRAARSPIINGSNKTYGNADADRERPEHLCALCKTQYGKSTLLCPNEPRRSN
jgi:hypothetical protein